MADPPRHHRPAMPGASHFEALVGDLDPAIRSEAADHCATLLVRGPRDASDAAVVDRVVHLAETEGRHAIAELWSGAPPDSLAGCLWRLYPLRAWGYAEAHCAAPGVDGGRHYVPVGEVVAGVTDPPRPEDVKRLADSVLRGIRTGEFADTLFRAAAFAKVAAAGRVHEAPDDGSAYASDISAARLLTMAEQL